MEIRILIVSLACLSCLVPPALGSILVAKAAAIGAVKGAIVGGVKGAAIGAGVGLAAKGAAALVAKKTLMGVILKVAALKGRALLAAKKKAIRGIGGLAVTGLTAAKGVITALSDRDEAIRCARTQSPTVELLSGAVKIAQYVNARLAGTGQDEPTVQYRFINTPRIIAVPVEVTGL